MSSPSRLFRAIKVSCFKYEDIEDEYGQMVVMYVILVENVTKDVTHILHKRYSDFLELFTVLRGLSPEIDNFRFPNKSLFNNRSQFTLDRRLEGFNDFLQLAIKMKPVPEVTITFLGLKEIRKDSAETNLIDNRQKVIINPPQDEVKTIRDDQNRAMSESNDEKTKSTSKDGDEISNSTICGNISKSLHSAKASDINKSNKSEKFGLNSGLSCQAYAEENVRENVPIIGYCSLTSSVLIYSILVLFGIIDTTGTAKGDVMNRTCSHHLCVLFILSIAEDSSLISNRTFFCSLLRKCYFDDSIPGIAYWIYIFVHFAFLFFHSISMESKINKKEKKIEYKGSWDKHS